MDTRTSRFLVAAVALTAAHQVGDHWLQTTHQASTKGGPGWRARLSCASHVATYTATQAVTLAVACRWLSVPLRASSAASALTLSAVTHYLADRRAPLRRLAQATGRDAFHQLRTDGMNGAYLLDQSWHHGWIFISALLAAGGPGEQGR